MTGDKARTRTLRDAYDQAVEALAEYADHQSWRCEHAPHFYLPNRADAQAIVDRDDCYCGLRKTLRDLGIDGSA